MRRIRKDELRALSVFYAEHMYEIEPFQSAMNGINPQKAKFLIAEKYYGQLVYALYKYADIFVSSSNSSGDAAGGGGMCGDSNCDSGNGGGGMRDSSNGGTTSGGGMRGDSNGDNGDGSIADGGNASGMGSIRGAIIGINGKTNKFLSYVPIVFDILRIAFWMCSFTEIRLILRNMRPYNEVRDSKWSKKHIDGTPYYFALFAIDKESRGTGLCGEMLQYFFDYVKTVRPTIILETHTAKNVPLYEHYGFELAETKESTDSKITEYRMIKKL
ncbi:MAG: GNAT family N-acetyltransferase [Oscillospiraceae bacterium]|nr:GNAT family N-acetyltransferase [Oscillospiraceae bacterium]